jgi:hypothetical protein
MFKKEEHIHSRKICIKKKTFKDLKKKKKNNSSHTTLHYTGDKAHGATSNKLLINGLHPLWQVHTS